MKNLQLLIFALVLMIGCGIAAADFIDNFDRANGVLGNGWTVTGTGNSAGGTVPAALIVSNEVKMTREGWGSDANVFATHSTNGYVNDITADIYVNSVTGNGTLYALKFSAINSVTGAFIMVQISTAPSNGLFRLRVANSANGDWPNWSYYYPADTEGQNPGVLTVSITTDTAGNVAMNALKSDDSVYTSWSSTNAGLIGQGGFDTVRMAGNWAGWTTPSASALYFDNVIATMVPEPATLALLACGAFGLIRRKK